MAGRVGTPGQTRGGDNVAADPDKPNRRRRKPKAVLPDGIRNVVVVSDTHLGDSLALCHPDGAALDDGGTYQPSKLQLKIWDAWEDFWSNWVPEVTHGEPFVVVHNGDAIDGVHHSATTQWSHNLGDQSEHAYKVLKPVVDLCEGRYFHIRGTEAHVGRSATEEERLARRLGAVPNAEGQHARYELWLRVGGKLCHFLHHVGTTSSSAHESSAVNAELAAMYADAGRWSREPPMIVVRSHRHRCIEIRLPADGGYATVFVTPAWQLKTAYAWKIAGARVNTPQIGGSLIRVGDTEVFTRHYVKEIGRSPEVSLDSLPEPKRKRRGR